MKRSVPFFGLFIIPILFFAALWFSLPAPKAAAQQSPQDAGTPWYNASWHYRRPVTISNSGAAIGASYQISITLTTTNFDFTQAKSDGSDLRVTNSGGMTLLPFWIESWSATLAYVWVKMPSVPAGSSTIYLYYGVTGTAASASDGSATFDLFDDRWCQFAGSGCTGNPVHSATQSWWESTVSYPMVFEDTSFAGRPRYHMLYDGHDVIGHAKGYAWSSDLKSWTEYDLGGSHPPNPNPIIANPVGYPGAGAQYAWGDAIKVGDIYYMYVSRGPGTTQRVESTDLVNWSNFITLSDDDPGGNIGTGAAILKEGDGITPIQVEGRYWMVYFHGGNPGTMYMASSTDLLQWTYAAGFALAPTSGSWDAAGLWTPSFARLGGSYYIYYQGDSGGGHWETGYATASAYTGETPLRPDNTSWTKSATAVITHGTAGSWDSTYCIDPMIRKFSTDPLYYVFYTGNSANGFATATSPTGPWTKYAASTSWSIYNGGPIVSNGIASFTFNGSLRRGMRSIATYTPSIALGYRANFGSGAGATVNMWGGFMVGTGADRVMIGTYSTAPNINLYLRTQLTSGTEGFTPLGALQSNYHVFEVLWRNGVAVAKSDHGSPVRTTSYVPTVTLPVNFYNYNNSNNPLLVDWVYIRQYRNPEPSASVGAADPECAPTTVYVDATYAPGGVGAYIWNCTAFNSIQTALDTADLATTVNVAAGTYAGPVLLNRSGTTVSVNGDITLSSDLTVQNGTFSASARTLSIGGNFTRAGGAFANSSGTVIFTGAGTHNMALNVATTFNNLTVDTGVTLVETVSADNATVSGTLTNNGTIRKSQAVGGTGALTFGLAEVTINVTFLPAGDPLTSLMVDRIDQSHPDASGDPGAGTNTGRYWLITPTGSGYTVNLTLPHSLADQTKVSVCRYDGPTAPGYHWNCSRTSSTATTVTRNGITQLSPWAVGNDVGPTAVQIVDLAAKPAQGILLQTVFITGLLAVLVIGILILRRRVHTQP